MDAATAEICANVAAILDSGLPVLCDLSGGQDSRILLGALIALDRVEEVAFNTNLTPNKFGELDLAIGSGLVKRFGGTYEFSNPVCGYTEFSFEEAWAIRRSQLFGTYHFVPPTFLAPGRFDREQSWVRMGGACGEIYRNAFPSFLSAAEGAETARAPRAEEIFGQRLWGGVPDELRDDVVREFAASFCALDGSSFQEKLNTHHLTYRSRFHFGSKLSLGGPSQNFSIGPLYSPSLLAAVRGLPDAERATGRAVFDITKSLCEPLPYYPHDKPKDPIDTGSPYHRSSPHDGSTLELPNGADLIEARVEPNSAAIQRAAIKNPPSNTQAEFFDGVLADAVDFFRGRDDWSRFLAGPALVSLVDDQFADNRVGRLRMASKLQFVKDLVELSEG
jgi:hypothetical protein